jgi:hypothetical protein
MSHEKELDIGNKLNNYLKITGIINSLFRPKKYLKKTRIKQYNKLELSALLYRSDNWNIKTRHEENNSSRDESYEKYSRIHLDRL